MKKSKGFTLIELMIVVAIIGVLAAIAIPKFADLIRKSNEGATKGNLGTFRSAMSIYYGDNEGVYPGNYAAAQTAANIRTIMLMENGKYLDGIPMSFCPPYHSKFMDSQTAGNLLIAATPSDTGQFAYQQDATPGAGEKRLGEIWVNCTHTDTKTGTWTSY